MVTADEIALARGQGRAEVIARQMMRSEIDAAYRAGRRSALEDSPSGLFALITGLVIGLVIAGLVSWGVSV